MSRIIIASLAVWLTKIVVEKSLSFRSAVGAIRMTTAYAGAQWLVPFRTQAMLIGRWFPVPTQIGSWYGKFTLYQKHKSTCIGAVSIWDADTTLWLADADGIKAVAGETTIFQKDVEAYKALNFYGNNLVGTEGADWRRHRRVAKPAFNETGNAFVWVETVRVVNEWFSELATKQDEHGAEPITIDATHNLLQVTLLIISSSGFGRRTSWQDELSTAPPPGHLMAFRPAVVSAVHHLFTKVLTPDWLYTLAERVNIPSIGPIVKDTKHAYEALKLHMLDLISLARAWVVEGKIESNMDAALLRNLVEANMATQEDDDSTRLHKGLTDDELLSNTFTFLLAGHETTAHSLSFAMALLALYPDVQTKIHEEALKLWPNGLLTSASSSSYKESMAKLPYTVATFHETIRLFPAIVRLAKLAHADTTIPAHRFSTTAEGDITDVQEISVPVKAGTTIMLDILGVHMNPMYWGRDVAEFKPERFIDTESYRWPRDAFVPFSAGPRNCIGQRFALTQSVCLLASLVRTYKIFVPEDLQGVPFEEQKRILLGWTPRVTMTPKKCFVRLQRRDT
ncbi:cytochrome P450 [Mycena filopes]|nr:cytochrome P450 [Mycena filopes]